MSFVMKCIDFMLEKDGSEIQLVSNKEAVIALNGQFRTISSNPVKESYLSYFLAEAFSLSEEALNSDATESYEFNGAAIPLTIVKQRKNGALALRILPVTGESLQQPPSVPPAEPEAANQRPPAPQAAMVSTGPSNKKQARIDEILRIMISDGASDLHMSSNTPPYLRKDGEMMALDMPPFAHEELYSVIMEIAPERNRIQFEADHDTDFAYEIEGLARFRCNYFYDRYGCGAVFRQIPTKVLTCEELGLPEGLLKLCYLTKGLVVVTGPTGSGKSTTLAALIDHINKTRSDHIITIEDPIEFVHENQKCLVNQREVNVHTNSFKNALRAALREDPDIVLVGEMRDLETISIAIETAETGHLVFGTLHTTTAVSTVDRIIDQFPADQQSQIRVMLSESLRGVIAQTLCKKIGGGRVAALEIMMSNRAISNNIREGKTYQIPTAIQTGKKDGMVLLNEALINLVNNNLITADEAYMKAVDKDGIRSALAGKGLTLAA